ncbi:MAG: SCP2 sterol-binding domain-containing protein [bacterium]
MEVKITESNKMNLIGYFLRDILKTNLSSKKCQTVADKLQGAVVFDASGMKATLIFGKDAIEIYPGTAGGINAKITGDLNTLLDVALGANYLKLILAGKLKIGGNLFLLLKLIKLLRVIR